MSTIHVDSVSAEASIYSGAATMVVAPAEQGEVGIAPRHAPLVTRLKPGEIRITTDDGEKLEFFVSGGILEVQPNLVTVLADTALRAHDIDEAEALKAKQHAEEALESAETEMDIALAQAEVAELAARLKFVRNIKKRGG